MKFIIEQIAIMPPERGRAIKLLREIGLEEWANDLVVATGEVNGFQGTNVADLAFNYDAGPSKPLEFEVLNYRTGKHWMMGNDAAVSHLGMHVADAAELNRWRRFFEARGILVAQEVDTDSHTNPVIAGKRWYKYVIFNTRPILGVDLKFILRKEPRDEGADI